MAPLEPWEKVLVKAEFLDTVHGRMGCVKCHNGNGEVADDKNAAHQGLIAYPSDDAEAYCSCHEQVDNHNLSIHRTQEGYYHWFEQRAGFDIRTAGNEEALHEFEAECGKCHASCGQCHVIQPVSVGGGFAENWGHIFRTEPHMKNNCTACHGSRVGDEYTGAGAMQEAENLKPDIHYQKGNTCDLCHTGPEMHGDGSDRTTRYDAHNTLTPKCEDCHLSDAESNEFHQAHWSGSGSKLSCQVCHSQTYKSCNSCHAGGEGITGSSYPTFKIGQNYMKSDRHDYDFITVRHIPIAPTTFEEWGITLDDQSYTSAPTWKMTTPHNIRKITPQTDVEDGGFCGENCHNSDLFLRESDIEQYNSSDYVDLEIQANQDVFMSGGGTTESTCLTCHLDAELLEAVADSIPSNGGGSGEG